MKLTLNTSYPKVIYNEKLNNNFKIIFTVIFAIKNYHKSLPFNCENTWKENISYVKQL